MSALTIALAIFAGIVLGIIGAYYYTIWKTKKIMAGLFDNMNNLQDPEAGKRSDSDTTGTPNSSKADTE